MNQPLFLKPVFKERIWGGNILEKKFGYDIPSEKTGECWGISGHPHGPSIVMNGPYAGKTLIELWDEHRELFGNYQGNKFPLLTKILDANTDLSVQVHPDDKYALTNESGELGKTECWYVIDCKEGAEIIYGHHAQTKEQFKEMIEKGEWDQLLRKVPIKKGDFFYVTSGMIHALCEGTLILETQQNSDTTYRVYDYDRIDKDGEQRELHIEKALDVSMIPHKDAETNITEVKNQATKITSFVQGEFFSVYMWEVNGKTELKALKPFMLASVIDGDGQLITEDFHYNIKKGDHFIVPNDINNLEFTGKLTLIVSKPN